MVRVVETQTDAPNSIPLPLHVILELNKHTLTLPCSVAVWLGFWKSEHDETRKCDGMGLDGTQGQTDVKVEIVRGHPHMISDILGPFSTYLPTHIRI